MFNEIYGNYYNIMSSLIGEAQAGTLTGRRILDVVMEKGFGESIMTIPDAVKRWGLITDDMETPIVSVPSKSLTILEKRWLKALLGDPRIKLFGVSDAGLEDVKPLYEPETFVYFDKYKDGDPYEKEDYIANFKTALAAIKEARAIRVKFATRHQQMREWTCMPIAMEFSEKDDKFRLIVATGRRKSSINVARISHIEMLDYGEEIAIDIEPKEKLVTTIFDERNALERAMLHFSTFETETIKNSETEYTMNLYYDKEDETELLIRILQFGPFIKVHEPESMVGLIKERLKMQSQFNDMIDWR